MNVLGACARPVNASPAERAALLRWALCYWNEDALTAYAESDGWEGCADIVLRSAAMLRHVIWIGIHVRRRSCREAAEDFAKIAVRNDIWRSRYVSLAQTFSEDIGRWAPGDGDMRLTTIWREARAEHEKRTLARAALKPPTLDELRRAMLSRSRRVHA